MASTTACGFVARITSPITATPLAPADKQSGAFAPFIPPSAITGPGTCAAIAAKPSRPIAGPYPGLLAVIKIGLMVT